MPRPPSLSRLEHTLFETLYCHAGADLRSLEAHLRGLGVKPSAKSCLGRMLLGEDPVPLDVLLGLVTYAGGLHEALRAWAPLAGCMVVDADEPGDHTAARRLLGLVPTLGETVAAVGDALVDGTITSAEASGLRGQLSALGQDIATTAALLDQVAEGDVVALGGAA